MTKKIFITGFPYVREAYFATFRKFPEPERLLFLLPKIWKLHRGKVVFHSPKDPRVIPTTTLFYHSRYPIIGGVLKGWQPLFPWYLFTHRREVDLVYTCSEPTLLSTLYNAIWTKIMGKKHVSASWENIPFEKKYRGIGGWFKMLILKLNMRFSDGLIAGNAKAKEIYQQHTSKPIAVIPLNGVDPDFFSPVHTSPAQRKFRGSDFTEALLFTFVGAIGYRKGIHVIVEAFSNVIKNFPHAKLIIAGSGEYESEIKKQIEQCGLGHAVARYPWINHDELKHLLSISDVFLYPSISYEGWEEQFGYSIAEASLMEVPVIATRSGSIEDVVEDGKTGLLVTQNDAQELGNAMQRLARDETLRRQLGIASRKSMIERFSNAVVAKKFSDFFSSI